MCYCLFNTHNIILIHLLKRILGFASLEYLGASLCRLCLSEVLVKDDNFGVRRTEEV